MSTERISPRFIDLDSWETGETLEAMLEGQMTAVAAVLLIAFGVARALQPQPPGKVNDKIAQQSPTPAPTVKLPHRLAVCR